MRRHKEVTECRGSHVIVWSSMDGQADMTSKAFRAAHDFVRPRSRRGIIQTLTAKVVWANVKVVSCWLTYWDHTTLVQIESTVLAISYQITHVSVVELVVSEGGFITRESCGELDSQVYCSHLSNGHYSHRCYQSCEKMSSEFCADSRMQQLVSGRNFEYIHVCKDSRHLTNIL